MPQRRADHVHTCLSGVIVKQYGTKFEYCYRCNEWYRRADFELHLEAHSKDLDMFCGLLYVGSLLVCGGRCPFCIRFAPNIRKRMRQFTDISNF